MSNEKKIVVQIDFNCHTEYSKVIDVLFSNTIKPDIVFLNVSSIEYPNRVMGLPNELVEYVAKNPKVKFMWDGVNPLSCDNGYKLI